MVQRALPSRNMLPAVAAGLGAGSFPSISLADNRFTLIDAAGNTLPVATFDPKIGVYVDIVVVDINEKLMAPSKQYYDVAYDPKTSEGVAPACFSDNGVGPSSQSARPQAPTCAVCPHNVWGSETSKMTGKQTKACRDFKKLAVIIPDDPYNMVYLFRVPPASLKHLREYADYLAKQKHPTEARAVDAPDVITRVWFESQGVIKFHNVGWTHEDDATLNRVLEVWKAEDDGKSATALMLGKNDQPINKDNFVLPAAKVAQAQPLQGFQPAPALLPTQGPGQPQLPTHDVAGRPITPGRDQQFGQPQPPPPVDEAPKRRGRPPASPSPPAQLQAPAATAHPPIDELPPFLQRKTDNAPPAPPQTFGIVRDAPPPTKEVNDALDAAFGVKTR